MKENKMIKVEKNIKNLNPLQSLGVESPILKKVTEKRHKKMAIRPAKKAMPLFAIQEESGAKYL